MGPLDLLNHLLNFVAPALFVGTFLVVAAKLVMRRNLAAVALWKQVAINVAVGVAALLAGLIIFGRDGKMATYAALVICCASSQWWLSRSWRK
ncbi:MAG: hypothetical protein EON92_01765 [Burkholderiales bacterium]|nr:MAG: hypothetical protein EON92_01765 [Burkholderiales bacterium]